MAVRDTVYRKLTYEDYVHLPEDGHRHEILDGEHYVTPAPSLEHQGIAGNLHLLLAPFVRQHQLGKVFFAPVDVLLSQHDVAQPDLFFVSAGRSELLTTANVQGAPDLVVEILSDSSRRRDETLKRERYESSGVLEYWLIDPERRTVRVFQRGDDGFLPSREVATASGDVLTSPLFPGLEIPVRSIFE